MDSLLNLIAVVLLLLAGPLAAQDLATPAATQPATRPARTPRPPAEYPTDARVEKDVAYLGDQRQSKADFYYPLDLPADARRPVVILIHGGGFNDGDKARPREISVARYLARDHGYVCMSIDYRLSQPGTATWPQCLFDAENAVLYLRRHAERLQVDPDRIAAIGFSAGGNLAAMLATTGPRDGLEPPDADPGLSTTVRCAVNFYGPMDLVTYKDMKAFNATRAEAPDLYRKASPVTWVDSGDAPLMVLHGTRDETVPLRQSELMAEAMKAAGMTHELVVIPDAPHTFDLTPRQRDLRPVIAEFLRKHLKTP